MYVLMKTGNPGSRRQKIILYYALAVVLPGILLGYMAYRGIRNDQALREKENRRKLEMNSQDFFTAIDSGFVQFMNEQTNDSILSGAGQYDPSLLALICQRFQRFTKAHNPSTALSSCRTPEPPNLSN